MATHHDRYNYREKPFAELRNQIRAVTKQIIHKYHYKSDNSQEQEALKSLLENAPQSIRGHYLGFAGRNYRSRSEDNNNDSE